MNKLAIRLFVNTAIAIIILCLSLFLPASSLDYWQGWIYLTVFFFVPPIFITPYLLKKDPQLVERRVTAKEQRFMQKLFRAFFFFLFFSLFVIAGFDHRFHWSHMPTSIAIVADVAVLFELENILLGFSGKQLCFFSGGVLTLWLLRELVSAEHLRPYSSSNVFRRVAIGSLHSYRLGFLVGVAFSIFNSCHICVETA